MPNENGRQAFSVRLPEALVKQIDERASLARRHRNAEIQLLIEQAIDLNVARDIKMIEDMRKHQENATTLKG